MQNHWQYLFEEAYKTDEEMLKMTTKPFSEFTVLSSPFARKMSVGTNQSDWTNERIIKILLTVLSRSVKKNLDLGRVYRPHNTDKSQVNILPYRPPARLIRAYFSPMFTEPEARDCFTELIIRAEERRLYNDVKLHEIIHILYCGFRWEWRMIIVVNVPT